MTLDRIRQRFPHPTRCGRTERTAGYCVGGAFLMSIYGLTPTEAPWYVRYPDPVRLSYTLENRLKLAPEDATKAALAIAHYNDAGRFKAAWDVLGAALALATESA